VEFAWSFYKSFEFFTGLLFICFFVDLMFSSKSFKSLFDLTFSLYFVLAIWVWLGILIFPHEALISGVGILGYQIQGVLPKISPNGVGEMGAIISIVAINRILFFQSIKLYLIFGLVFGIFTMVLSQSRSPIIGFFVAICLMLYFGKRIKILSLALISVLGLIFLTPIGLIIINFLIRGQSLELLLSLSGRINIWHAGWQLIMEKPFFGHGSLAGTRFLISQMKPLGDVIYSHSHNVYFETLIGVGIIGLIPLILCIFFWIWREFFISKDYVSGLEKLLYLEAVGIFSILMIRSFFSSFVFINHPNLFFLLILGYSEFLRRKRMFSGEFKKDLYLGNN